MRDKAGTISKWATAVKTLTSFVNDPRSAGLGVGLQYFPLVLHYACNVTNIAECKFCYQFAHCVPPGRDPTEDDGICDMALLSSQPFVPALQTCTNPTNGVVETCTVVGRCSISDLDCTNIGQPCPSFIPGDTCVEGGVCFAPALPTGDCNGRRFTRPVVPITILPSGEQALTHALTTRPPSDVATAPIGPSAQGALEALRAHQMSHPERKVALVLISDGLPQGCFDYPAPGSPVPPVPPFPPAPDNTVDGIAQTLREASTGGSPIPTYVIGILAPAEAAAAGPQLDTLAVAGGTGKALVLGAPEDLARRLEETFNRIRGALPCEYGIPRPGAGGIDPAGTNVSFTTGAGVREDVPRVARAEACDPDRGGWYYDVEPSTGMPARIITCDATCKRLQSEPQGRVDLAFGCAKPIE
jgi:hypothetical protein